MELGERDGVLRLYDPVTETWFGPGREHIDEAEIRASEEARARQDAESRASEEARARQDAESRAQHAETELAKLHAALERLEANK